MPLSETWSPHPRAEAIAPSERIGRYALVRLLGEGGMGRVWEARVLGLPVARPVALKVLHPGSQDTASVLREAQLGAALSHPNVVSVHEVGQADDTWFLAMELVHGITLADLLVDGPLAPGALLAVATQVCVGLAAIHGHGLVHRDIKPQNLLVDATGTVRIADLGLTGPGRGGRVGGTPGFLPPEQLAGEEDHRADLYALGATLVRAAGHTLSGLDQVETLFDQLLDGDEAPQVVTAPLDDTVVGLAAVVSRCLEADPDDRWPDAQGLLDALARLGQPNADQLAARVLAARPGLSERPAPPPQGALSVPRTVFVGRASEQRDLLALLEDHHVVEVTGPGGIGKTRLARQVATLLGPAFPGGVWLVDGQQREASALAGIIAEVAGLGLDDLDDLGPALASRGPCLVVLDGVDEAGTALSEHLTAWRAAAPETRWLLTTRQLLGAGTELPLGPLASDDAVQLYRARSDAAVDDVLQVVDALDRVPLAIELAASAPLAHLPNLAQVLDRHRDLESTLRSSVESLPPRDRGALLALAVFAGGASLVAAQAVMPRDGGWALDVLDHLVRRSLVWVDDDDRFRVLAPVRDHVLRTSDASAVDRARGRHIDHYAALCARRARPHERMHRSIFGRVRRELDDIVLAARRAIDAGRPEVPVLAGVASFLLMNHVAVGSARQLLRDALAVTPVERSALLFGQLSSVEAALGDLDAALAYAEAELQYATNPVQALQARRCHAMVLSHREPRTALAAIKDVVEEARPWPALHAHMLEASCCVAWRAGECGQAVELGLLAIARLEEEGLADIIPHAQNAVGLALRDLGRLDEARQMLEAAYTAAQANGQLALEGPQANDLALVLRDLGDHPGALTLLRRAERCAALTGCRSRQARAQGNIAGQLHLMGDLEGARAGYEEALALQRALDMKRSTPITLANLGDLLVTLGEREAGIARLEEALHGATSLGHTHMRCAFAITLAKALVPVQPVRAAHLLDEVEPVIQRIGARPLAEHLAGVRATLEAPRG